MKKRNHNHPQGRRLVNFIKGANQIKNICHPPWLGDGENYEN